ncbi:MAG: hypothetical protein CMJ45_09580 [Planctomyces sp.]|nr:hypothetical protein [Planctomyces sp.]
MASNADPGQKTLAEEVDPVSTSSSMLRFGVPTIISLIPLLILVGFAILDCSDVGFVGMVGLVECFGGVFYLIVLVSLLSQATEKGRRSTSVFYWICWLFWMCFSGFTLLGTFLSV